MAGPYLGIDHLGIAVGDLTAARQTYRDLLGFTELGLEELPARGLAVAMLGCGESRLELLAATRADAEISTFLARRGEGLHHVAVRVADLDRTLAQLAHAGVRLIDTTAKPGAHGSRVAFVHPKGTHGVLLELVEQPGADGETR